MFASSSDTPTSFQARRFIFVGKKNKTPPLPQGIYQGVIKIHRTLKDGSVKTITASRTVRVE